MLYEKLKHFNILVSISSRKLKRFYKGLIKGKSSCVYRQDVDYEQSYDPCCVDFFHIIVCNSFVCLI